MSQNAPMPSSPDPNENLRQLLHECRKLIPKDRLASVGASIAIFAHEVGNRLNNLSLQAQVLERELKRQDNSLVTRTQSLRSEIDRLNELLTELRSIDEGLAREAVSIDLAELVREVVASEVKPYLRQDINIDLEIPDDLPQLLADATDVRQIVFFLVQSATESLPNALVLRLRRDGTLLVLELTVKGAKLHDQSDLPDSAQHLAGNHWGLGLLLVRHRARALGGSVRWSAADKGVTTFTVRLPVR